MSQALDERILERARTGDIPAWEQIIGQYDKIAYNLAYRFMGNREDAWDMSQEGLTRVYTHLQNFRGDASFETWLRAVIANVCLDELRKRKRRSETSLNEQAMLKASRLDHQVADQVEQPQDALERQETGRMVQQALLELDTNYRQVLIMRHLQDKSYKEVTTTLHISVGTLKSRLRRARHALKNRLVAMEFSAAPNADRHVSGA